MSTTSRATIGVWVSATLFWVFMIQFLLGLYQSSKLDVLRGNYNAPESLRNAAAYFQSSLAVEQSRSGNQVSNLRATEAWKKLEKELDGYARRLEIMQDLDWKRQMMLSFAYAASAFVMFVFTIVQKWKPEPLRLWHRQRPSP